MSTVQLRLGDMFDGPSDLIVLPCSRGGDVQPFVQQKLIHFNIPRPKGGMALGDARIEPFVGGENIAQYVAFAASVAGRSSSVEAIRRIGVQLGEYTRSHPSIRHVAAPLLGAGAGGLQSELVIGALREGFMATGHPDATLVISILHHEVYQRVRINLMPAPPPASGPTTAFSPASPNDQARKPLRVFISYTHSSEEHRQWVQGLATFLRHKGIEARLDVWHLRRGMDVQQFMTNELTLAERVILVCDEKYAEKANGRVGGVGWETMLIQGDLYQLPPDSLKYLIIVRSHNLNAALPVYLKTKFVIQWPDASTDQANHTLILRELFDQVSAPPIGAVPVYI